MLHICLRAFCLVVILPLLPPPPPQEISLSLLHQKLLCENLTPLQKKQSFCLVSGAEQACNFFNFSRNVKCLFSSELQVCIIFSVT